MRILKLVSLLFLLFCNSKIYSQVVSVGSGSYTTTFPGVDAAGRNGFPSGVPNVSGVAANKPAPTNDWWSHFIKNNHGGQAFNYPLAYKSRTSGLSIMHIIPNKSTIEYREPMSDVDAIVVGVNGLNASKSTVADHSDWTVSMNWSGGGNFTATMGVGMPFTYFTKGSTDIAKVAVNHNPLGATVSGNKIIIRNNFNGANYVVFGPAGTVWTGTSGSFTSNLNGKNYWSMAMIPFGVDVNTAVTELEKYAYVFPGNTQVAWNYNSSTGAVRSTFTVTPDVKEGTRNVVLQGLLPHQWSRLAADSPQPAGFTYATVRGQLKMLASNSFVVQNKFSGILPTLPNLAKYSSGFDPGALYKKIDLMKSEGLAEWTDSYNEGQMMNKLIQAAHIANQIGHIEARNQLVNTVKARLEDWLKVEGGEVAFLFYYNNDWKTMIGYPAGHRQDLNLNDHHFHWGYFIHAAAAIEQYQPGWASQWGPMINLLVRDAASPNRNDTMFPFLRNFNPYQGHAWANGFASEPFGNDQESTSESMQFNSSLIHWGTITGNTQIRDLGIFLYTTEQSAVEEYWFDVNNRTFQPEYVHEMVARIWGGGYDNGTWWTQDIAASYGIQLYPIHGGALYMGQNTAYVQKVWDGMKAKTAVLQNTPNDNLWYDTYWSFLSFLDPAKAIELYNAYPNRNIKFGVSDAQTYHWLHTMNAMGQVHEEVTANYPIATVFAKSGVKTYVAYNYGSSGITVQFSDGYSLPVPAKSMATSRDINVKATLSSSAMEIAKGGSVTLTAAVTGTGITKVDFYRNNVLVGSDATAPYSVTASNLSAGLPNFYARAYVGTNHNVSNIVTVQVGAQLPYPGPGVPTIPGTIEAGNYDYFEGGNAQGVSYSDATIWNEGNYRTSEAVDAGVTTGEGFTVGWIDAGEWLEYTINATTAGLYNLNLRYTSGNATGGGPFWFENEAGNKISPDITVTRNDASWTNYTNKATTINLAAGRQVIRMRAGNGGFNLGRMTFTYAGPGNINPSASITSPATGASFTAPASIAITATATDSDGTIGKVEFYNGTTKLGEDLTAPYSLTWSNVSAGTYSLTVKAIDNLGGIGTSSAVTVKVGTSGNLSPTATITSPVNGASFTAPASITINANASDSDGTISKVEFYNGAAKLGEDLTAPYSFSWSNVAAGTYTLTARAVDNLGANGNSSAITVTVTSSGNLIPTATITSPVGGTSYTAPATITINANASDPDGTISKVEFYNGTTKLGEDLTAPYSFTWSNVVAGSYTLTARAFDNLGASKTSTGVSITVNGSAVCKGNGPNAPGTTTPDYTWQATNTANPTITFIPGSPISGSDFAILYVKVGASGYAGYIMDKSGANFTKSVVAALGSNVSIYFTYRTSAGGGERNSSASPHNFVVGECGSGGPSPIVSITSPANGATFTAPATINITANASSSSGTISKVEFYSGTTKLGEDLTSPFTFSWANVSAGNYAITAKAIDNSGNAATSSSVSVVVGSGTSTVCSGKATNGDYSYEVSTTSGIVKWTFIPLAPIAGSNMAIIYINGVGYQMAASGSNFTFSRAYTNGQTLNFYFTYRVGTSGVERNSSANPHTYIAGTVCSSARLVNSYEENGIFYPNPVENVLYLKNISKESKISITDLKGNKINIANSQNSKIDLSILQKGVYILEVVDGDRIIKKRIIKN